VPVDADVLELIRLAQDIHRRSNGAYDITVGPWVRAYGFGAGAKQDIRSPNLQTLRSYKAFIGMEKLSVFQDTQQISKAHPKLELDFSSVAKGHAVDQVVQNLQSAFPELSILMELGGEILGVGEKTPGVPWQVGIEQPTELPLRAALQTIPLKDLAMATSGTYRQSRTVGQDTFTHTLDARTGIAKKHHLLSVTVFAPRCALADAWATALLALGPEEAPKVAETEGLEAVFVFASRQGQPMELKQSRRFQKRLGLN